MQAVMAIPRGFDDALQTEVAGVPLLVRVLATAKCAGVDEIVLLWTSDTCVPILERCAASPALTGLHVRIEKFQLDPRQSRSWIAIDALLKDDFVWLPWNFVTSSRILAAIEPSTTLPPTWSKPVRLNKELFGRNQQAEAISAPQIEGVSIHLPEDVPSAERFLVSKSGKPTDGIYSNFNRKLSRPFVRALTHTSITPNTVTLAGLVVGMISAFMYSRGYYLASVAGAVLFFISGLIDEMDGMLARLTFRESAFGTWFEGFVDNATYLLLFSGMTAGLYRQHGKPELIWGIALIAGCLLSVCVVAMQRRAVAPPDRPHEYSVRINRLMETDSSPISRIARQVHIFVKKGVAVHYVLIFTVIGGLQILLRLAAIAANLTWTVASYFTWRFTHKRRTAAVEQLQSAT